MTERRKDFEDYVREQTNKFNQEHRAYSQAYQERRQALELKKRADQKAAAMKKEEAKAAADTAKAQTAESGKPQFGQSAEDKALIEEMNRPRTEKIKPLKAGEEDK